MNKDQNMFKKTRKSIYKFNTFNDFSQHKNEIQMNNSPIL